MLVFVRLIGYRQAVKIMW